MKATVTAILIAMCCAAVPAVAEGAFYAITRETTGPRQPDFHLEITVRNREVVRLEATAPQRCDPPSHGGVRWEFDKLHIRVEPDGSFRWKTGSNGEFSGGFVAIGGRVVRGRIFGRFGSAFFIDSGHGESTCWTGRGVRDPWMRFVARRQTRP